MKTKRRGELLAFITAIVLSATPRATASTSPPLLLGVNGRPVAATPFAVVATQGVALRILSSDAAPIDKTSVRLVQIAGVVARPLDTPVNLEPDPADSRLSLVSFTTPAVERPATFGLRLGDSPPLVFTVFPAYSTRSDRASLAETLETSRLRLLVCGPSNKLRAWLRSEKLQFDDEGVDPPDRIPDDALLLGVLNKENWQRLAPPGAGRVLAFVEDQTMPPGVYADTAARRAKITLPILSALPDDPLACETLHTLLLDALTPPALEK